MAVSQHWEKPGERGNGRSGNSDIDGLVRGVSNLANQTETMRRRRIIMTNTTETTAKNIPAP
jgi:hypothetical protein